MASACVVFESDVLRLCGLLAIPIASNLFPTPTLAHFEAWKPLAEQAARDLRDDAKDIARLIEAIGIGTCDEACHAKALWISGNIYYRLRHPAWATERFEAAEGLYRRQGDLLSIARMSVGWLAALNESGNFAQTIVRGKTIAETLRASYAPADAARLAGVYNNLGLAYQNLGDYEQAIQCFRFKLRWFLGQQDHAKDSVDPVAAVDSAIEIGSALTCIGIVQSFLGQYIEADNSYRRAKEWFSRYGNDPECRAEIARVDLNVLWLETLWQRSPAAVERAIDTAHASRLKVGSEAANEVHAQTDLFTASWFIFTRQYGHVDYAHLEQLHAGFVAKRLTFEAWFSEFLLGQLDVEYKGDRASAMARFEAIERATLAAGDDATAYQASIWKARALAYAGRSTEAQHTLEAALSRAEARIGRLTRVSDQIGYLEDKLIGYRDLAGLHLTAKRFADVLAVVERAKAKALNEKIGVAKSNGTSSAELPGRADGRAGLPFALRQAVEQLPEGALLLNYSVIGDKLCAVVGSRQVPVTVHELGPVPTANEVSDLLQRIQAIRGLTRVSTRLATEDVQQQIRRTQIKLQRWHERLIAPVAQHIETHPHLIISPDGWLHFMPFQCLFDARRHAYLIQTNRIVLTPSFMTWLEIRQTRDTNLRPVKVNRLVIGSDVRERIKGQLPFAVEEARRIAQTLNNDSAQDSTNSADMDGANADSMHIGPNATCAHFLKQAPDASLIYLAAHGRYREDIPALSYIELADGRLRMADVMKLDLTGAQVVLSACETAHGRMMGNEMLGLPWAFLHAGACAVTASTWQIDDQHTLDLMTSTAAHMRAGLTLPKALNQAQNEFINSSELRAHPFYWGGLTTIGVDD